jgi:hypothetical protein
MPIELQQSTSLENGSTAAIGDLAYDIDTKLCVGSTEEVTVEAEDQSRTLQRV